MKCVMFLLLRRPKPAHSFILLPITFLSVVFERIADTIVYFDTPFGSRIEAELSGDCQTRNAATVFTALLQLRDAGFVFTDEDVARGFAGVCAITGLAGRWMKTWRFSADCSRYRT